MIKRKIFIGSILLLTMALSACQKETIVLEGMEVETIEAENALSLYETNLIHAERGSLAEFTTATQYELTLHMEEPYALIEGEENVTYWNNEDVALEEIYLRMFPNNSGDVMTANSRIFPNNSGDVMTVTSLMVNGEESDIITDMENTALRIELTSPLEPGENVQLEMTYSLAIPTDFGGNYGLFSYIDGILALDQPYLIIPVYDDEGWNVEVPPPNGDMIYADAAFFTVTVEAPVDLVIAASGVQVAETEESGMKTHTFVAGPVRDFYLAGSADYEVVTAMVGETLVSSYYHKDYKEGGEFALRVAVDALETFNERFGVYPYTELDIVSTPMQAIGMEYSSVVAMGVQYYDPDTEFYGSDAFDLLQSGTAHEVAHQWFFNMVMSDQIDEPWIDEGMAQFLTALYFEDTFGAKEAKDYQDSWENRWERVSHEAMAVGLPVRDYGSTEYSAIIYGRAPIFISTLRKTMGDEMFFDFLKALFEEYKWGIVTTEGYRDVAEEVCDCDLQAEFDEWVYPD